LKEAPADAEIVSHKLLLRAGLCRKLTGGLYTFLPLGLRVLRKVEQIIREEMNRAGALEVLMPALQPPEIWQKSAATRPHATCCTRSRTARTRNGCWARRTRRSSPRWLRREINSYRQLPKNFYQIQREVPGRDPPPLRPDARQGVHHEGCLFLRRDDEGAMASYRKMYDAYTRIFARCGLQAFPVEADTGVIGGNYSHEFMVPAETGENEVVYCESGGYAANIEKATSRGPHGGRRRRPPPGRRPRSLPRRAWSRSRP
jgi:prolyl-tRNA synthetase